MSALSGYPPSHPWFYVLGGTPLSPKQILAAVKASGYRGYLRAEIEQAAMQCEPRRSQELRKLRSKAINSLRFDLTRYRECARELRAYQRLDLPPECESVHVSLGLKHAHLYNEFAHLTLIDDFLSVQPDLFG